MKSLEKQLLYIFLILLPFNIKKYLASGGMKPLTEFNSFFLYATDLVLIGLFVLWILRSLPRLKKVSIKDISLESTLVIFFLLLGISSSFASPRLSFSLCRWGRVLLGVLLFFYLKNNLRFFEFKKILKVIFFSGLVQSLIAIAQYFKQASLGLHFLGESVLSPTIDGVAKISIKGERVMRSYGTFPHPNLLAVFLLVSIFAGIVLILKNQKKSFGKMMFCYYLSLGFLLIGLGLTFSRSIIFFGSLGGLAFLFFAFRRAKNLSFNKVRLVQLVVFIVITTLFVVIFLFNPLQERLSVSSKSQAVILRNFYQKVSIEALIKKPFWGIGAGNSIFNLRNLYPKLESWIYQPTHNIYLLVVAEMGLMSFFMFLGYLVLLSKKIFFKNDSVTLEKISFSIIFFSFLGIGLFDHFFFTINQGILIFWLALGCLAYLLDCNEKLKLKI